MLRLSHGGLSRTVAVIAIAVLVVGTATAGSLLPDGNPIYTDPATGKSKAGNATAQTTVKGKTYTVTLDPNPATFQAEGDCPWLLPALNAPKQPYNNPSNEWVYETSTLEGSFKLVDYFAWAKTVADISLGATKLEGGTYPDGFGGASFVLNYDPKGDDPKANDPTLHWMQVIDTNMPTARGVAYGVKSPADDGTTVYMDNSASSTPPNAGIDPYYGHLSNPPFKYANGTGFLDQTFFYLPDRAGEHWQAQAFLSTETSAVKMVDGKEVTVHTVTIYDGVWWGYTVALSVPEPSSWILALVGAAVLLVRCGPRTNATWHVLLLGD